MLNLQSNSNRNSFCGNGNSNRNSAFYFPNLQNGNTNTGDGNANTEFGYLAIDNYEDIKYMDDVDEKTPMNVSDDSIDKKILMTKTTSV